MTDKKEIIIDGVDVSGCADFITEMTVPDSYAFVKLKNRCFQECKYDQTAEQDVYLPCRDNPNCYFKQLSRKTQECETLASQLDFEVQKKECLEQECEKLKSQVDEDYNYYTTELKTLRDIISNKEKRNAALFLTSGRYRKALEDIKEVINNILNSCLGHKTKGCTPVHNVCGDLIKILDIINKAKDGK